MISIFSMISAFLIWHSWQTSGSLSPQAELGHQHSPLCCFQITQFLSIMAQVPLTPSQKGLPSDTNTLIGWAPKCNQQTKNETYSMPLEMRYQQGNNADQLRWLASYTNTLIGWAPKCNQQTKNETYSRLLKCSTSRGNNADQLRWLAAVAESLG